jgi:RNA polymerase sigma factor (sigma-70 family)
VAILGYALRRTHSPEDAADIVAETFLTAWRRLDEIPRGEQTRLWLYGVARRVLANARRAEGHRDRLRARIIQADLAALRIEDPGTETHAYMDSMVEAFAALGQADRDLLGLIAWEGLSYKEIGSVLGCTEGAARIRAHRARRRLATHLERLGIIVKHRTGSGHVSNDGRSPIPTVEESW